MQDNGTTMASRSHRAERERRAEAALAHIRRCRARGMPTEAELERMVAEFRARGGQVTACTPAHVLPVHNGAGRDAERWVA
ncbi:hypothetical protein [Falsiroseomonas oryzae]|uniref:hypothetical protein n=1 Tax=Falsiroseomonas oryzae TaxID=2766473 RepID=UPI0022EA434C|nr:hypothetical protein [Roseomonas sp. MO-31]